MSVAILVPVLGRPQNVAPLLESIAAATSGEHRVLFIADPYDFDEHRAIYDAGGSLMLIAGNYAQKINAGVRTTSEPLLFLAADDLHFHPGWLEAAQARMTGPVQVVGVNDLIKRRPGREGHATHFLMSREYATSGTIDGERGPLFEGYDHSWVDNELIATATHRGAYAYEPAARVEHRHPMNGTADDDDTYRRGRERFREDRRLHLRRRALWA